MRLPNQSVGYRMPMHTVSKTRMTAYVTATSSTGVIPQRFRVGRLGHNPGEDEWICLDGVSYYACGSCDGLGFGNDTTCIDGVMYCYHGKPCYVDPPNRSGLLFRTKQ